MPHQFWFVILTDSKINCKCKQYSQFSIKISKLGIVTKTKKVIQVSLGKQYDQELFVSILRKSLMALSIKTVSRKLIFCICKK